MLSDPRLIELELLAKLDNAFFDGHTVRYLKPNPYGGHDRLVHEAWLGLVRPRSGTT